MTRRIPYCWLLTLSLMMVMATPIPTLAETPPELSYPRLLRKITLTLRGTVPSAAEYQAIIDAPDDATKESLISAAITSGLASDAFYESLYRFARTLFGAAEYRQGLLDSQWLGSLAVNLSECPSGSLHGGRLGIFGLPDGAGDLWELCDDPDAQVHDVEPWWAAGTTVPTIGWAGAGYTSVPDPTDGMNTIDCGVLVEQVWGMAPPNVSFGTDGPRCGCGPNLIYCARRSSAPNGPLGYDGHYNDVTSQSRALSDESARLFAHIIVQERPLTDLITGTYTVATLGLQHAYVRAARQSGGFGYLDTDPWWTMVDDPNEWREVQVSDMFPVYTSERVVQFDPRIDFGEVPPIPSAGVLTMRGTLGMHERERVRAARWLERLACRSFVPPPPELEFTEFAYDPAAEGRCQTCHAILDPVAMHFKRFASSGWRVGGFGEWRWSKLSPSDPDRLRWLVQYQPNTLMTPVTEVDMVANPDARFLDFAPPGTPVLGSYGDGTIGPLGFGKALVESGEFDRCMVQRIYSRYSGVQINQADEKPLLDSLVATYLASGRNVLSLITNIVNSPRFRIGR